MRIRVISIMTLFNHSSWLMIYDPRANIAGIVIRGKKTLLNDKGIRVMTPTEWGNFKVL